MKALLAAILLVSPVAADPNQVKENDDAVISELVQRFPELAALEGEAFNRELRILRNTIVSRIQDPKTKDKILLKYFKNLNDAQSNPPPERDPAKDKETTRGEVNWNEKVDLVRNMREEQPDNPYWWTKSGDINYSKKDYKAAFNDYGKAIELGANDPQTFRGYAGAAHQLGDFGLARDSAALALRMDPSDKMALSVFKLSQNRESTASLPSALGEGGAAPQTASVVPGAMGAAGAAGRPTAAQIAAAIAAQAKAPASAVQQSDGLTKQAAAALGVRDYTAAQGLATNAIELNSQNARAWNFRAIANEKLGNYKEAEFDASAALALVPQNSAALQTRAWALNRQGRYEEGLADANAALEMDPRDAYAYQGKAFSLAGMGLGEETIEALKTSAQLDARFQGRYDQALQAPDRNDLLFLFDDGAKASETAAAPPSPEARKKRFAVMAVNSVIGGVLVALGLLHTFSGKFREQVKTITRRFIGGAPAGASAPAADGQPAGGQFWGQYELLREIGSGGMGVVFEAKDRSLDRSVAIKKMRDELRVDPQERNRFMTEAKTVAGLHHPNIVDIYSVVEDGGDVYLVFEYVNGKTLADVLKEKGPLPFETARRVLKTACEAVDYAHKHKVIHRDIKPSNIMISEDGQTKVMDFGVARQAKDALTKQAMTNTVVGTPPYMAPEQEQGTVRTESDLYSLAIVFYETLSGQLPFAGQGAGMLLNKMNGKIASISQTGLSGLPVGMDAFFAKALHPDPEKRFKTPSELSAAVDALGYAKLV